MFDSLRRLERLQRQLDKILPKPGEKSTEAAAWSTELVTCPDPVEFSREHLGIEPWGRQAEILRAVAEHPRVAVRSGHKISKSNSAAGLALWWWKTRRRGQVVMTSSTNEQIRLILWPELTKLHRNALRPIGGRLGDSHRSGLVAADGRRVVGIATNQTENMGGFSGDELLFIADEASGIDEAIFDAIEGNRAGGARVVMFGNPTKTSGRFFDAFHNGREFWHCIHVSSEEAAAFQATTGRIIPGLATQAWVDEKRKEWGEDSPLYQVRVRGNFPSQAANSVIGLATLEAAAARWAQMPAEGALELGLDPARFGDDESVLQPRRGLKTFPAFVFHGLDGPDLAGKVLEVVRQLRRDPTERPRVKVDVIGYGASAYDALARSGEVLAIAVNVADAPTVTPEHGSGRPEYAKLRDQLWFALAEWLKSGGTLHPDTKLEAELVGPTYSFDLKGRLKVEAKNDMKKRLGRSPDRADALALAIYTPPAVFVGTIDEGDWMGNR